MALTDVGSGTSGNFTDVSGNSINWTSNANHSATNLNSGGIQTAAVSSGTVSYTFSSADGADDFQGVQGLAIQVGGMGGFAEGVTLTINGSVVNLNTLIANGQAQIVSLSEFPGNSIPEHYTSGANDAIINEQGAIANSGSTGSPEDQLVISFNFPIHTLSGISTQTSTYDIFLDSNVVPICFTRGTLIMTAQGDVPVEELSSDDEVLTVDAEYQPIRWIGSIKLSKAELEANPEFRPIRIRASALGRGVPEQDLVVSPQHRILVRSEVAERVFGVEEALIAAKKLVALDGVDIDWDAENVEYWHFLFDEHQIVWANGALSESLFIGPEALKAVSPEARKEISELFPEICEQKLEPAAARFIPRDGKQVKNLVHRLQKNKKVALETYLLSDEFKQIANPQVGVDGLNKAERHVS